MPEELRGFYMYLRQAFGPFAQGPVALVSRHGDECVFSVDALGLRPLWPIETADAFVFSSEAGVVAVADTVGEPKPLAPGEKLMVTLDRAARARAALLDHPAHAAALLPSLARAHRQHGRTTRSHRRSPWAARSRAPRSPATRAPGRPSR